MMHANVANDWWQSPTQTPNDEARQQATERQNQLTKPPGSLGMLEQVAIQLAALQGQTLPTLERVQCVLFAGDHGVAAQGVSAFSSSRDGRNAEKLCQWRRCHVGVGAPAAIATDFG